MLSATRSAERAAESGRPLPEVPALYGLYHSEFKCRPRRGQVTMIFGQPASQKSGFALWWTAQMNLPTLYFSADMAQHTAITRLGAILTGETVDQVSSGLESIEANRYVEALVDSNLRFCFDPDPTPGTITEELEAWVEMWDSFPEVIVIDNLMDMNVDSDSELMANKQMMLYAKSLARDTGAAIFILHHASENSSDPTEPAPRRAVMNKVSQSPEAILSVALDYKPGEFKIGVVKYRSGKCDPTGRTYVTLRCEPEYAQFYPSRTYHQKGSEG